MNIKPDHQLDLAKIFSELSDSNIVFIDRRLWEGKLRYVILDVSSEIIGVTDEREVAFAAARQYGLEPLSAH